MTKENFTAEEELKIKETIEKDLQRVAQSYLLAKKGVTPAMSISVREFDSFITAVLQPMRHSIHIIHSIVTPHPPPPPDDQSS